MVILDPGHGGPDSGAIGPGGTKESEINLCVALQIKKILHSQNIECELTRTKDEYVSLQRRIVIGRDSPLYLSIHCNGSDKSYVGGIETIYNWSSKDYNWAKTIHKSLTAYFPLNKDRGLKINNSKEYGKNLYVLRALPETTLRCLVELEFITNPLMEKMLMNNTDIFANALAEGIQTYLYKKE